MIKVKDEGDRTVVEIKGRKIDLMQELTAIVRGLNENPDISEENIRLAVKVGLTPKEDLNDLLKEELRASFDKLLEAIDQENIESEEEADTLLDKLRKRFK